MSLKNCTFCGRNCSVDRTKTVGFCGVDRNIKIAKACLHFGEEPCISGISGSGTIFFSGCSLKCVFCQNFDVSQNVFGKDVTLERLAEIFKELESLGAHNINLVTPTHYLPQIEQALCCYSPKIPIVYNTSGYDNTETIKRAAKFANIFLIDLKYLSNDRAKKYSNAENYPEIAQKAIKTCIDLFPKAEFNDNRIMQKGVIIRHLILPQGTEEAKRVIDWVSLNANEQYFSLMSQYTPFGNIKNFAELNRTITKREYEKVIDYLISKKLQNVFVQELSSSTEKYIPKFDLSGV